MRSRIAWSTYALEGSLLLVGLALCAPVLLAFAASFQFNEQMVTGGFRWWPSPFTLSHYVALPKVAPFGRFFINSIIVCTVSTVVVAYGSLVAGFVFAKYRFRGQKLLLLLIVATIIIPMETYILPLYLTVVKTKLVNTLIGVIYPTVVMSSGIFFLRQTISTIPDDLLDAARIDGCSEWRVLRHVIAPLSAAATAAICILNWVFTWSLFLWPLIVASDDRLFTMEVGVMYFMRENLVNYGGAMAAASLSMLPVIAIFLIFRRQIVDGIAHTGVKG